MTPPTPPYKAHPRKAGRSGVTDPADLRPQLDPARFADGPWDPHDMPDTCPPALQWTPDRARRESPHRHNAAIAALILTVLAAGGVTSWLAGAGWPAGVVVTAGALVVLATIIGRRR